MAKAEKDNYLIGKVLLAMPGMADPRFHKAVIFLCAHDEKGAMGLVINHKLPGLGFSDLLEQLGIKSEIHVDTHELAVPIMSGGPVESARGFLLHSSEFNQKDTIRIGNSYSVTGTVEALKKVAIGQGPDNMLFILGYAGWGAGQLEAEIQQNSWLVTDPDPNIIFHAQADEKWTLTFEKMGIDPAMLSAEAGRA